MQKGISTTEYDSGERMSYRSCSPWIKTPASITSSKTPGPPFMKGNRGGRPRKKECECGRSIETEWKELDKERICLKCYEMDLERAYEPSSYQDFKGKSYIYEPT